MLVRTPAPQAVLLRELLTPGCCRKCDAGTLAALGGLWERPTSCTEFFHPGG